MFERILVAIDGTPTANRGLRAAMELAVDQRATVFALHVIDDAALMTSLDAAYVPSAYIDRYYDGLRERGRKLLAKAETFARSCGVECKPVLVETMGRSIAQTILRQARTLRAEVIVLGTHGRRGLQRMLMGSDAEEVVRDANVPVMLVRNPHGSRTARRPAAGRDGAGTRNAKRAPRHTRR